MSRIVALGEIMARFATPGHLRFQQAMPGPLESTFAGAEANAAMAIAHLGGQASLVTALPDNPLTDACLANLRSAGVGTQHVIRRPEGRLGLFFLESGVSQRPAQVIYDRSGSTFALTPPEAYDWASILAGAEWLLISGITPAVSATAAEVTHVAMKEAEQRGVKVAFDANYRSKLWQWEEGTEPRALATRTIKALMPYVTCFLGGPEDAAHLLPANPATETLNPEEVARRLVQEYPRLEKVAFTLRSATAAHANELGGFLFDAAANAAILAPLKDGHFTPYPIPWMVDRLGAGDAFTGSLLFAFTRPELHEGPTALAFAVAAACLAHTIQGDFNYISREEIETLMSGDGSWRVRR